MFLLPISYKYNNSIVLFGGSFECVLGASHSPGHSEVWARLATEFLGLSAKWKCKTLVQKLLDDRHYTKHWAFLSLGSSKAAQVKTMKVAWMRSHSYMEKVKSTLPWALFASPECSRPSLLWYGSSYHWERRESVQSPHFFGKVDTYMRKTHILLLEV